MLAAVAALPALGGRPLTTEDAIILEDKACQVEAWMDRSRAATDAWLVPACNFGAHVEWQAGAANRHETGRSRLGDSYAQAKTVFRRDADVAWNAGLVLGVIRRPSEGWDSPYALLPFTATWPGSTTMLHANIGWLREQNGRHVTLWGLAAECCAGARGTILGEVYGENAGRPFVRVGARYAAIRDRLDLDVSWVARPGGAREERFLSLGVTWQRGRFLP